MKNANAAGNAGGFTLIEVMITMFFIMFIIEGVAMVSLYAQRSGIYARRLTSANIIAEQRMEELRNKAYQNLVDDVDGTQACYSANMLDLGGCGASNVVFTETIAVTPDDPVNNVAKVDVTVAWEEGLAWNDALAQDGTYQAKLVSYISRN